jgi:cytochrome c oxidase assembly protein subunit 15
MIWLHRYTRLLAFATLLLVAVGGMVTSTASGLSVPDWPTTYGYSMFSFPVSKMVGGIFYEHGHRLIATAVGALTIGVVVFLWRAEPRRWVRVLGWCALGAVCLQGLLGGLTVLLLLPDAISISHAGLAQLFFGITIALALVTSRGWREPTVRPADDMRLRQIATAATALIYTQILIGATMRHMGAGLAIPDFPLSFGHIVPPVWTLPIAVHFAHRVGALVVTIAILATAGHVWYHHGSRVELTRPATLLVLAVLAQATLGAFVIWTGRQPLINTAHVAMGAIVLATSLVLTLRVYRVRFAAPLLPVRRAA